MRNYTENTGGSDGDNAAIVVWKEQDEVEILNHDFNIKKSLCLTVVYIFNKLYGLPLVYF